MKPQFDHNLMSSFYLWADNRLVDKAEAVVTGRTQIFKYAEANDIPSNMNAFYSADRQFCADHEDAPNHIFSEGWIVFQNTTGQYRIIFDHDQGRVLLNKSFGTGIPLSGQFVEKEINLYTTNETEEEILMRNEFFVNSGQSYSDYMNQLAKAKYYLPCVFLTPSSSDNRGFAFGGVKDTKTVMKAMVFARNSYQLQGVLGTFRDTAERNIKIISHDNFPYGAFWHVRPYPYSYPDYITGNAIDETFIKRVGEYKLKDNAQASLSRLRKDMHLGFIEFELSSIRETR